MNMLTSPEKLFCQALDRTIPALSDIDVTFREKGLEAAEKQLADYVRTSLDADKFFRIPYRPRENVWALPTDDDFAAAEKIISGNLCSVGVFHQFPDTAHVDWESNPTPNQYKEWTWQLNRHHEWRCLGHCYRLTGDEKYAKAFVELLMSWCEQAPCPENDGAGAGKCWRTIEAGIRMNQSWPYAIFAFRNSPHLTDHVITTLVQSLCDHGYRLRNFHGGGNWYIIELSGLSRLGMFFPFLAESSSWIQFAFHEMEAELERQVYPDGFQFELTTGYHNGVLGLYYSSVEIAGFMEYPVPQRLSKKLSRMIELDINLVCPDGLLPALNDGGRGSLQNMCLRSLVYFPDHEAIRYFASDRTEGKAPDYTSIMLPYSGLACMRTGWEENDLWCLMDVGPFGHAHQHEDKLNILLSAYGKNLLVDPGNYAYDASAMRGFILDTRSHNCALVDDLSQNRRGRYDGATEPLNKRADASWSFSRSVDSVEGTYNQGFGRDYLPVTHKRKLILFKEGLEGSAPFALVIDRFLSEDGQEHTFQPSYQLGLEPYTDDGMRFTADHGDGVSFTIVASAPHSVIVGQTEPLFMGWKKTKESADAINPGIPSPCVRYAVTGETARMVTALCPYNGTGKAVTAVDASRDIDSTRITVTLADGSRIEIHETDYPCAADGAEKLFQ